MQESGAVCKSGFLFNLGEWFIVVQKIRYCKPADIIPNMLFDAMISSDFVHAKMKQTPICQIMEGAF